MKLLIDTGSTKSIIKPSIIEEKFPNCIYQTTNNIKTALGSKQTKFQATVPILLDYGINHDIDFILFDFHDYFDGVIGLNDLCQMNLNINLVDQKLIGNNIQIPFKFRQPYEVNFSISVNPYEKFIKNLPVSVFEGEILTKPGKINELYFPQILSYAKDGFAPVEIQNYTDRTISITLQEPIPVDKFESNVCELYTFENVSREMEQYHLNRTNTEIDELIRTNHMNTEERREISKLCKEYSDIFYKPGDRLTFTSKVKHNIRTEDEIPVHSKSYRYPYVHTNEIKKQINEMLDKGIIRPSSSPWSSPIWIVPKKMDASGKQKWRVVVDYRKINEKTIDDRYPIPNINDILDKLGRCNYFSTLDLANGFHQIEMEKNSIEKTAFSVDRGHYEYTRMPFGLKNAPSTFQRVMDEILKDIQNKICMVYMDDIIIFSTGLDEHIRNLKLVFKKLREARLKIQLDKSEFLRKEVEFLGHIITAEGIKPNKNKIEAIKKFPIPKTPREIKSFLGLVGYYRKFIKNFAKITKPLTQCLKKNTKIVHTKEFIESINLCKNVLTSEPVLTYPDFTKTFELTTDASNYAIGAILSQNNHPICYASRTLNSAEINYSTIEKELLAIVWSCKYFRPYLFGQKFVINTDHKPLQWLFSLKEPNSRLVRWRLKLEEFDYKIQYKKGKLNQAADALSRNPIQDLNALETQSIANNSGDADDVIDTFLNDLQQYPQLDPSIVSEILGPELTKPKNKINIISDIQIRPPFKTPSKKSSKTSTDLETIHTSLENPIFNLPISEKSINVFKHQIILTTGDIENINCRYDTVFQNTRLYVTISIKNTTKNIIKLLKEFIDPKQTYALYFRDDNFAKFFTVTLQNLFKNSSFKFVQANRFLQDIEKQDDQIEKLNMYHTTKTCHRGITEMKNALSAKYYWPKMLNDIENFINNCETCQKNKYDRSPPVIKFNLTPTCSKPFEHIHVDTFKIANEIYLTIIDTFSRYGQAYHLKTLSGIEVIEQLFNFITHHGLPLKITTDSGTEFKNKELENFCKLYKIDLHYTTPKNSNSNSPVERFHSTLIEHYRCLREENNNFTPNQLIKRAVLGYNNAIHSVTKFTPFEIIKGHINTNNPFDLNDNIIISNYVQNHKETTKKLYDQIQENNHNKKEQIINKRNEDRIDPPKYLNADTAYIKTKNRGKDLPKFKKLSVLNETDIKIETNKGFYHKNSARKPKQNISLQVENDQNHPADNCSAGPSSQHGRHPNNNP